MRQRPTPEPTSSGRTLVLVAAFLAIALMLAVPLRSWFAQRAELDQLRDDISAAQTRVDELTAAQERWRDAQYIAAQARLRLNMALPGEAALIAIDGQRAAAAEEPAPDTWYGRLWESTAAVAGSGDTDVP